MPPRVVIDINVLLSGTVYRGRPHLCLRCASEGLVHSVTTEAILLRFEDRLVDRFRFDRQWASAASRLVRGFSECIDPAAPLRNISRDPEDDEIITCAVYGRAGLIVTGDADLLSINDGIMQKLPGWVAPLQIVTPRDFLLLVSAPGA